MKYKIIIGALLLANAANASTLIRALEDNLIQAQAIERQEHSRYSLAKDSYHRSKDKVKSLRARIKKAKKDELNESRQLRAIEKANAEYYEIPQYRYNTGDTGINWRTK